ncbi:GH39 family glycosyl hydrolase [Streptacidiphilus albus]|uniref:GH39 family glycosyl hydrolase n=1 Tax=Streptacidiphilus albus TaxID=105425 RepID=UPI00054C72DF|nr:discoidin domain-containing protein [Streptacidiphilus albus]
MAVALTPAPARAAGSTASFSADYATTTGTTISSSLLLNGSEGGYLTMQNLHWFPQETGQLSSIGLQSVRVDHIFDDTFYHLVNKDSSGNITYDFTDLDKQILPMVKSGITPFMSLSFMPAALGSDNSGPPTSDTAWGAAVSALVSHYAALGYTGWDWEIWNEPDNSFSGTQAQYDAMYAAAASAVKAADPTAEVGGPAVYNLSDSWTTAFLSYLQANPSVPLDFFSYHSYFATNFSSAATAQADLTGIGRSGIPVYVTEWNDPTSMTAGAGSGSDTNSSDGGASYAAARLYTALGSDASKVFWFSPVDGYTPADTFNGDLGMVTENGHRKAVGNVFWMYSQLAPSELSSTVSGTNAGETDVYGVASKNTSSDETTVLLWNNTATDTSTSVSLTDLPYTSSNFSVTQTLVDSTDGNYYNDYTDGANADTPSPNENAPVVSDTVQSAASSYSGTIDLPANSVSELILKPTTSSTGVVTTTAAPLYDDLAYGAPVTYSSTYTGTGWAAANLTDGQDHSFESANNGSPVEGWTSAAHSTTAATEWAQVDLGSAKTIDTVVLWPRDAQDSNGGGFPTAFTIAGSTDDSTWTTLYSASDYNGGATVDGPQSFAVSPASYRYIKVTATTLGGAIEESGSTVYRFQLQQLAAYDMGLPNAGFESGSTSPWTVEGKASVESSVVHSGTDAVTVTGAGNGVQYTATGLSPDTTYTFGGYLRSGATGDPVYLGVKGYGGTETAVPVSSTQWTPVWITFTTGASSTSATVYMYKNSGTAQAWGDDFTLQPGS